MQILDRVKISDEFISNGIEVKMMKFDEKDPKVKQVFQSCYI